MNLAIVVPCFNEEEVLPTAFDHLAKLMNRLVAEGLISFDSTITFVDDGSKDKTWRLIEDAALTHCAIHGIKLSRNRGHQNALIAGLMSVNGDAIISVDADLQDDLSAIREMVIVYSGYIPINHFDLGYLLDFPGASNPLRGFESQQIRRTSISGCFSDPTGHLLFSSDF